MKLHILSDLHLEFEDWVPPETDADVVVLAGDIHTGKRAIPWIKKHFPTKPVVYVLGNHEYYGEAYPKLVGQLVEATQGTNIHVLDNSARWFLEINDINFVGTTLWTDFNLYNNQERDTFYAKSRMNDYFKIRVSPEYRRLTTMDTVELFYESLQRLNRFVPFAHTTGYKVVIVTHHLPSLQSVPEKYKDDLLSAAFASNLDDFVRGSEATLWVHGHTHVHNDYYIGSTRVVSNPKGYPGESGTGFIPNFIVEI